jgi:hypothetical protein
VQTRCRRVESPTTSHFSDLAPRKSRPPASQRINRNGKRRERRKRKQPSRPNELGRNALLGSMMYLHTPDIQLLCATCGGARNFTCVDAEIGIVQACSVFRTYQCRNCATNQKLYALSLEYTPNALSPDAVVWKVGEIPLFTLLSSASGTSQPIRRQTESRIRALRQAPIIR